MESPGRGVLLKFAFACQAPLTGVQKILRLLVTAAIRMPKRTGAIVLLLLVALAGTISYTGFLVVGVVAEYLGTGRVMAGFLLGALFARFPWIRNGKPRIVGVLPTPVRRPLLFSLLAFSLVHFLMRSDYLPAGFVVFSTAFLLAYPLLRRAIFDRIVSTVFKSTDQKRAERIDDTVIEGEFREKKD